MNCTHAAFYRFVPLADAEAVAARVRQLARGLTGSVIVAPEGVNGVLAGEAGALDRFAAALAEDPRFAGLPWRRSGCRTAPFGRLAVHLRPALVAAGEGTALGGTAVAPEAWPALLDREDVVVLDNRNRFEHRLGRFRGAVDPGVYHFRDFAAWVRAQAPRWRDERRAVAMYCTGGIRCDQASGWMADLGLEVLRLDGGILHFFERMPDAARDWEGECFVFDNRIALDTRLQETDTTAEQVYAGDPADAWRLARAQRLDGAT